MGPPHMVPRPATMMLCCADRLKMKLRPPLGPWSWPYLPSDLLLFLCFCFCNCLLLVSSCLIDLLPCPISLLASLLPGCSRQPPALLASLLPGGRRQPPAYSFRCSLTGAAGCLLHDSGLFLKGGIGGSHHP